jgi:hypothetical protein
MIKLPDSPRTKTLSKALDTVISDHKKMLSENKSCKLLGQPTDNPKITEVDLAAARVKGDIVVAPDVYAYYLDWFDEKKAKEAAAGLYPNSKLISLSGKFHYPPKGYMGWHTNSNMEGWRVYATYCEEGDKSFFRYFDKNKMLTEYEKQGWNFRAFQVKKSKLYWHCVYSDTNRYSFGFRFQIEE